MKWLGPELVFPPVESASHDGLLAVGGDYAWPRILVAYQKGIFPWSNPQDPILWWSPDPRFVLFPEQLRIQKSMRPLLTRGAFEITYDTAFGEVIRACGKSPRGGQQVGTWISDPLIQGYTELHEQGFAHSIEARDSSGALVGGLYGVAIGRVFCGESMFAEVPNASKYAFIQLVQQLQRRGYWMIDCQMPTEHLERFGAESISRREFVRILERNATEPTDRGSWADWPLDRPLNRSLERPVY